MYIVSACVLSLRHQGEPVQCVLSRRIADCIARPLSLKRPLLVILYKLKFVPK